MIKSLDTSGIRRARFELNTTNITDEFPILHESLALNTIIQNLNNINSRKIITFD